MARKPTTSHTDKSRDDSVSDEVVRIAADSRAQQVIKLLHAADNAVRQQRIKEELGWSIGKTSYVLQAMEDVGLLCRMRDGKEKVAFLPQEPPVPLDDLSSDALDALGRTPPRTGEGD